MQVETVLMKPFYGASGSWINENKIMVSLTSSPPNEYMNE